MSGKWRLRIEILAWSVVAWLLVSTAVYCGVAAALRDSRDDAIRQAPPVVLVEAPAPPPPPVPLLKAGTP